MFDAVTLTLFDCGMPQNDRDVAGFIDAGHITFVFRTVTSSIIRLTSAQGVNIFEGLGIVTPIEHKFQEFHAHDI